MSVFEIILLSAVFFCLVLQVLILLRKSDTQTDAQADAQMQLLQTQLQQNHVQQLQLQERSERSLREQVLSTAQATRQDRHCL